MKPSFRWESNFLCRPEDFIKLWTDLARSSKRTALLISGRGFDPRTPEIPSALVAAGLHVSEIRLIHLVDRYNPSHPSEQSTRAAANETRVRELFPDASFEVLEIQSRTEDGRTTGGQQISRACIEIGPFDQFTDVIVDITALPSGIYFPLVATLLNEYDQSEDPKWNLHCVVCENVELDDRIHAEGGDRAERVYGFGGEYNRESEPETVRVWAPVLGEHQADSLGKIEENIGPDEVRPVLPFPSRDPRRGDELIAEYQRQIFGEWAVDPQGIIYAHEQDPFDLYLQLGRLTQDYVASLQPLGQVKTILSSHTSKLLSLGVLLAAFEHALVVMHVEPTGYSSNDLDSSADNNELFEIWLTGEPYQVKDLSREALRFPRFSRGRGSKFRIFAGGLTSRIRNFRF